MSQKIDYLISPKWIAPVIPRSCILEDYSVAVSQSTISKILPTNEALKNFREAPNISLPDQLLTPGFINVHSHAAMSLLRGIADDRNMMDWLSNWIWPIEAKLVDPSFVLDGTQLAGVEMIMGGTTTVADNYFFPDASSSAFASLGMRAQIGIPVLKFKNNWASDERDHLAKGLTLLDRQQHNSLQSLSLSPHAPYSVTDEGFLRIAELAKKKKLRIQLHLHETNKEVQDSLDEWGLRPLARIENLGILNSSLQAIHLTQLNSHEIESLAKNEVHVGHCPESNMKLGSGICPISDLLAKNVNVAIGTDSAASNNDLDMLQEVRTASFLSKAVTNDATQIPAEVCLEMITLNGAKFLGLEHKIGSIEVGKLADLTAIDMSSIALKPVYSPVSQLIYNCTSAHISNVWIDGKRILQNKELSKFNMPELERKVDIWKEKIMSLASKIS